jgi:uncharacterized protein YecT (DUF1311 family)
MHRQRSRLKTASLVLATFVAPSFSITAASASSDPWTDEGSVERVKQVIAQCLDAAASTPATNRTTCINAVYDPCEKEHGTSRHALNDCAFFSKGAWEARLIAVRSKLMNVKSPDPRFGPSAELIGKFGESERRWNEWNKADCDMQAAADEGGSIQPLTLFGCLSEHAANRALELELLASEWIR